ncbi:MAG TPA: penicillin-binding transpeptidase domain-containing protein [Puia sp.]|jgi:beta-lactamase class D|nr:penicillin-binding transpeptidase domain-containing protein [Puia sp.]
MRRGVAVLLFFPILFSACSPNNVTVDDSLQGYFDSAGVKGAFGLFDNGHGHFTIYNLSRYSDSFYTPGATFDIVQSLVAIQAGLSKNDSSLIVGDDAPATLVDVRIDTGTHSGPGHQAPLTLGECFRDTTPAGRDGFAYLSKRIRKDTLRKWVDTLQYGNKVVGRDTTISDTSAEFWEDNELKINCDQQLGLLKKLYFNQLPFFERTQEIVRRMMPVESNSAFRLAYKAAQGKKEDGHSIGWVEGWVEENKHPYFFVVNLESADMAKDLRRTGLEIAKKILRAQGFFQGKK